MDRFAGTNLVSTVTVPRRERLLSIVMAGFEIATVPPSSRVAPDWTTLKNVLLRAILPDNESVPKIEGAGSAIKADVTVPVVITPK